MAGLGKKGEKFKDNCDLTSIAQAINLSAKCGGKSNEKIQPN